MKIIDIVAGIVLFGFLLGCAASQNSSPEREIGSDYRRPTPTEHDRAVAVAREFAAQHLELTDEQIRRLKPDGGTIYSDRNHILLQFYNPEVFPEERYMMGDRFVALLGGFPNYFTITIDMKSWEVVDHYASTR